jgi:ribosomal protein S18 acetylase RimI-like enzyme
MKHRVPTSVPFRVRAAQPRDIPALMRLKRKLAKGENSEHAVRASEADWRRDGFGPHPGFTAFIAECAGAIVGMATCSQRVVTGWNGPVVFLQDLFVETGYRDRGIARALLARVAALARELGSPIVELTVRADNPAQAFYQRTGFMPLPQCLTYILAEPALTALATSDTVHSRWSADTIGRPSSDQSNCGCQIISANTATMPMRIGPASMHQARNMRR